MSVVLGPPLTAQRHLSEPQTEPPNWPTETNPPTGSSCPWTGPSLVWYPQASIANTRQVRELFGSILGSKREVSTHIA
jgi:hypothetical protein